MSATGKFLMHPGEPITEDLLRKYGRMKKVEFNVGQPPVGLGIGGPLISDTEDMERIIRDNEGIHLETEVGTL